VDQRHGELLRRLAVHDEQTFESVLGIGLSAVDRSGLDATTASLVRFASCVASGAPVQTYEWSIAASFAAGATLEQVVGVLVALAPLVGDARVNAAADDVAAAIGVEISSPVHR